MKRTAYAAFGVAIMVTASAAPSFAKTPPPAPVADKAPSVVVKDLTAEASDVDPAEYWTPERMANAIPLDAAQPKDGTKILNKRLPGGAGKPSVGSSPAEPEVEQVGYGVQAKRIPKTAGKLFFKIGSANYVCSGSAVNSRNQSLVATAGHCVHDGKGGNWHSNFAFAPNYNSKPDPKYGVWYGVKVGALDAWTKSGNYGYDQGFIRVGKRSDGKTLIKVTGGKGTLFNRASEQRRVDIWGWPAASPYDGSKIVNCYGTVKRRDRSTRDSWMSCPLTGGASGGPWQLRVKKKGFYVYATTSRRTVYGPKYILATPFDKNVKGLFNAMGR